jgi:dimethylaniline monooxygenase (N-oxide forming)
MKPASVKIIGTLSMNTENKIFECIVIGAGPGGLVSTKELLENGVDNILCLDQASQLGGVFTGSYDNLQLTSSATFSMFSDFLNKQGEDNHFWSKKEAVDYWFRYAKHFGVTDRIRFNSKVSRVTRVENGGWKLTLATDEHFYCRKLVVATGNNGVESLPPWSKDLTKVDYSHSKNYKNSTPYIGKRVLVIGGGESASDMALEISRVASKCWVSLRESAGWIVPRKRGEHATDISTHRGLWGLPRQYGEYFTKRSIEIEQAKNNPVHNAIAMLNKKVPNPRGIWSTYGTKTIALAEAIANHGCEVVSEVTHIENGGQNLTTADGDILENIDAIVFSTGYINSIPFMPREFQSCDPRSLYKHVFHLETQDALAFIGVARPGFGSQFPIMELQARLFALICNKKKKLPSVELMTKSIDEDYKRNLDQFEKNAERIRSLVDYFRYMDGIADIIGCKPPLFRYFFQHPLLWLKLVYGPTQATQYRLVGPGSKKELAKGILKELPISTFNNVVKIGLKMRFNYALDSINLFSQRKSS